MTNRVVVDTKTGSSVQFNFDDFGKIYFNPIKYKSLQTVTVQGKQLFDKAKVGTVKYINPTTGVLTTSSYNNNVSALIAVSAGQSVTISGHTFVQPNTPVGLAWYGPTGTYISGVSYQNATGNGTYTAPAGTAYVRDTVNNVDLNTSQMEIGTSATPYAAFVPNSPSLDYPATITSTGDGGSFVAGACGKNFLNPTVTTTTGSGITATMQSDKSYVLNGTSTATAGIFILGSSYSGAVVFTIRKGTYTLKGTGTSLLGIYLFKSAGGSINTLDNDLTFTLTEDTNFSSISIRWNTNVVINNITVYPQLELGTTATTYEAYKCNTVTVNSGGGDLPDGTADTADLQNKKKTQNKTKTVFSGAAGESWSVYTGDTSVTFTNTIAFKISLLPPGSGWWKANKFRNTHFRISDATVNPYTMDAECFAVDSTGYLIVRLNKVRLTTQDVAGFKGYIATVPFTVEYPLITPVTSDVTVTPSNYLTSYKGITNVYTTDATQPIFTATLNTLVYDIDRYLNLITSEHSNKPKYTKLIEYLLRYIDLSYLNIDQDFDIDSAVGFQLDIIGTILGLSRKLNFQPSGGTSSILTDTDYRTLLKSKIILNQWNGTMETLSDALSNWSTSIYFTIKDNQDMSVDISVVGATQLQKELISNGYVIPKPAGVKINYSFSSSVIFAYDSSTSTLSGYDTGSWL